MSLSVSRRSFVLGAVTAASGLFNFSQSTFAAPAPAAATPPLSSYETAKKRFVNVPVPGSGKKVHGLGDDFEDEKWGYNPAGHKSSFNIDKQQRLPGGISHNRLWSEAALRGQPDVVRRVEAPPGGIEGSKGAMMLRSYYSGIPGHPSYQVQQDDFLHNTGAVIRGAYMPVHWMPNVVTHVYMPAWDQWERRTGNTFGFRAGMRATHKVEKDGVTDYEEYWPGFFIWHQLPGGQFKEHSAHLQVRSDEWGRDLRGPSLKSETWYTLGMSFTPDGGVHYFVREGVDELRVEDHVTSFRPYNYTPRVFETFFFNTVNMDDGRTWSTPWIIDDSWLYVTNAPETRAQKPQGNVRG